MRADTDDGSTSAGILSAFERLPDDVIARFLQVEYPQTAALVLHRLSAGGAAGILRNLPPSFAAEVARRIALSRDPVAEVEEEVLRIIGTELPRLARAWDRDARTAQMHDILSALGEGGLSDAIRANLADVLPGLGGAAVQGTPAASAPQPPVDAPESDLHICCGCGCGRSAAPTHVPDSSMEEILSDIRRLISEERAPDGPLREPPADLEMVAFPADLEMVDDAPEADGEAAFVLAADDFTGLIRDAEEFFAGCHDMLDGTPNGTKSGPPDHGCGCCAHDAADRVLTREQIDELLGFGELDDRAGSGLMALVNSALVNYERLPMLEVVIDRLAQLMSWSLRNFTGESVEVSLDQVSTVRFGDYLNSIPLPAIEGVFKAEEWDGYGLLVVDDTLAYSLVNVLLGGPRRGWPSAGRPYTTVDRTLVERFAHVVLSDLSAAFDPVTPATFRLDRLETNPRFAAITRPATVCILAKLRVDMEDCGGRLEMLLPCSTLEPVRELLREAYLGEKFGRDGIWEHHIAGALLDATATLTATLFSRDTTLAEAWSWRPGTLLPLTAAANPRVCLAMPGQPIGAGTLLERDGRYVVDVDTAYLQGDRDAPPQGTPRPIVFKAHKPVDRRPGSTDSKDTETMTSIDDLLPANGSAQPRTSDLSDLAEARMTLSVVVGKADLSVSQLLKIGRGAVVELNQRIGDSVEIYVNDKKFARGEIVVVEDRIAVSFTEIAGV